MAGGPGLDQKQFGGNHLLSPWPVHSSSLKLSSRIIRSQADPRTMKDLFCARPGLSQDTLRSGSGTEGPLPWLLPSQLLLSPTLPVQVQKGLCPHQVRSLRNERSGGGGRGRLQLPWRCDTYPCRRYREDPVWRAFTCLFMLSRMSCREVFHLMTETLKGMRPAGPSCPARALSSCPQLFALLSRGLTLLHRQLGSTCRHFGLNRPSGLLPRACPGCASVCSRVILRVCCS